MPIPMMQIDAFTSEPFRGNPAAVCWLEKPRPDAWLQAVAAEMNLSETAFLQPLGPARFGLRWFTPAAEVELCGHATLASAWFIWHRGLAAVDETLHFETLSGELLARPTDGWIELDFPSEPARACENSAPLIEALGLGRAPLWVGMNRMDEFVVLSSAEEVSALDPDMMALKRCTRRGVIVTAPAAGSEFDFVSRFFAPAVGIAEDPVTGSAHCCLGPYWAERLGRNPLMAHQVSARGGVLRVSVVGARVKIGGQATPVMEGTILAER